MFAIVIINILTPNRAEQIKVVINGSLIKITPELVSNYYVLRGRFNVDERKMSRVDVQVEETRTMSDIDATKADGRKCGVAISNIIIERDSKNG